MKHIQVPEPPVTKGVTFTAYTPTWLAPLLQRLAVGLDEDPGKNGITFDEDGGFVFYRKIGRADAETFAFLGELDEIWITFHLPPN